MKVTIKIEKRTAITAIAHSLQNEVIKSKKSFINAIKTYIGLYGELCLDDHESECGDTWDMAIDITNKYFRHEKQ